MPTQPRFTSTPITRFRCVSARTSQLHGVSTIEFCVPHQNRQQRTSAWPQSESSARRRDSMRRRDSDVADGDANLGMEPHKLKRMFSGPSRAEIGAFRIAVSTCQICTVPYLPCLGT